MPQTKGEIETAIVVTARSEHRRKEMQQGDKGWKIEEAPG
jgi:hypothetical protein